METLDSIRSESLASSAPSGAPAQAAPANPAAVDPAEVAGWASIPAAFGAMLCMAMPELESAYSKANCDAWGEAMAVLAKKQGWTVAGASPVLGVVAASVPMLLPTIAAVRARRAAGGGEPGAGAAGAGAGEGAAAAGGKPAKVAPV